MPHHSPPAHHHRHHHKSTKRKSKHGKSSRKRSKYKDNSSSEESISSEIPSSITARRQRCGPLSSSANSPSWREWSLTERLSSICRHRSSRSPSGSPRHVHISPARRRHRSRSSVSSSTQPPSRSSKTYCAASAAEEYAVQFSSSGGSSRDLDKSYPSYKVLSVSAIHPKASDDVIKDTLYSEYKRFGELSVRISRDLEERVAYVCFKNSDDAHYAKSTKPRVIIYDKVALVEPVYESGSVGAVAGVGPSRGVRSSRVTRSTSHSPTNYERYYRRSPVNSTTDVYTRPERLYDRIGMQYGQLIPLASRDYHRTLTPISHPEFLPRPPMHPAIPPPPPHLPPPPMHLYAAAPRPFLPFKPFHPPQQFLDKYEKKDKFPNYLHHVPPEDDPLATRTLFIGNLELSITEDDLRRTFSHFGVVEDVDIKRPKPGTGNAYAFVRYKNLDMAHRAKVELSGQYIGKYQCKIGYGKATPTTKIWVGGLTSRITSSQVEHEFLRFGSIKKIDYDRAEYCAYILYDSIDSAMNAVKEMRGYPLVGSDSKLRVDFADIGSHNNNSTILADIRDHDSSSRDSLESLQSIKPYDDNKKSNVISNDSKFNKRSKSVSSLESFQSPTSCDDRSSVSGASKKSQDGGDGISKVSDTTSSGDETVENDEEDDDEEEDEDDDDDEEDDEEQEESEVKSIPEQSRSKSPRGSTDDEDAGSVTELLAESDIVNKAKTFNDFVRRAEIMWHGAVMLKSTLYPAKFYLIDGDKNLTYYLTARCLTSPYELLRINQRLNLTDEKLNVITNQIHSAKHYGVFLCLPHICAPFHNPDEPFTPMTKHLREFISYLKQKDSVGVMTLVSYKMETCGFLYAFPTCAYSIDLLKKKAVCLTDEAFNEDHLVIDEARKKKGRQKTKRGRLLPNAFYGD